MQSALSLPLNLSRALFIPLSRNNVSTILCISAAALLHLSTEPFLICVSRHRSLWNGHVQQLIREELRPLAHQDQTLINSIIRDMGLYSYGDTPEPDAQDARAQRLLQLRSHGLVFPYVLSFL